jgi:hypothetical protein
LTELRTVALVPARDESDRIAATVHALRELPEIDEVVVVEDGSRDGTAAAAWAAGARVLSSPRRIGKGGALDRALDRVPADVYVFADGDLGASASGMGPLIREVVCDRADLAIAVLPPQGGGFGLVKRASHLLIRMLCGFDAREPLSGQRAATARALELCRPFASGFGLETAMTIDAVRAGLRVVEVTADLRHRPTGRDLRGFAHRGSQGIGVLRAVIPRILPSRRASSLEP